MAVKNPKLDAASRDIFDAALDGMFLIDVNCRYVYANQAACAIFGYAREKILSSDLSLVLFPEDVKISFDLVNSNWGRSAFVPEYRMRKRDGGEVWTEFTMSAVKIDGADCCLGIVRDVTDRRLRGMDLLRANEALKEEAAKKADDAQRANEVLAEDRAERKRLAAELKKTTDMFQAILDNSISFIFMKDINGRYVFINKCYEELFRVTRKDIYGKTDYDIFPKEQADAFRQNDSMVVAAKKPLEFDERVLHPDGKIHRYISIKFPVNSMPGAVCGIATDITERARMMEKLEISEERLKSAQRIAHMGSWEWNVVEDKIEWSDEIYRIFGLTPQGFGATYEAFINSVHPEDREFVKRSVHDAFYENRPYSIEHRVVRPDGTVRTVHEEAEVIRDSKGNARRMLGTVHDVTEMRSMEAEILKAQKLETIGGLAGGIAHDFNNILLGILGNVGIAKSRLDPSSRAFSILNDIEKAALRARSLTRQLLTFSKGGEPIKNTVQIADLIKTSARLVFKGAGIECEFSVPDGLKQVFVDEGQLTQVFNNIFLNAAHAMPGGGKISVTAESARVPAGQLPPLKEGSYVKIAVKDRGCGIAPENMGKIFDPFFTTKTKASGLGLAVAYSIIKKHEGLISVESTEGIGTVFYVYIPSAKTEEDAVAKEEAEAPAANGAGRGRILVMDDEEIVREVSGEMLRMLGFGVEFALDGDEAIRLYKKAMDEGKPFAGVIMDLTIPGGMGGREALKSILDINPKAKVIVSSGYSSDPVMGDFRNYGFSGVIAKPYRVAEFGRVVKGIFLS